MISSTRKQIICEMSNTYVYEWTNYAADEVIESSKLTKLGSLAQSVEHMTFNHGVPGSIPGWATK